MPSVNRASAQRSPIDGQGLFADASIEAGDAILAIDRPLIAVLDRTRIEDTCSWCFAWTELPVLSGTGANKADSLSWCSGCKKVKYCSKKCQSQAWKSQHKFECKIFAAQDDFIPNTVAAVMQILRGIGAKEPRYHDVITLESHRDEFEKAGKERWEAVQLMAHTALKLLGENEATTKLSAAQSATCVVLCNSFRVVTSTFDPLGLGFDPLVARINHSCDPNAVVVFDGPKVSVRALKTLKKGDELFISYIDNAAPFRVRQSDLKTQYFFVCNCGTCKLGQDGQQDAFRNPGPGFEERISAIDEMIPQLSKDPTWPKHNRGGSQQEQRLSALEFYAYSFLQESTDQGQKQSSLDRLRKIVTICRNAGVFPLHRAPLPAIFQQYFIACLGNRRYNEALIIMLRVYFLVDPIIFSQSFHPVRIVHAWILATLAKAVGSDQDSSFCSALKSHGVDLSLLFVALLVEVREGVPKSHGEASLFAKLVQTTWVAMMESDGELDVQYAQMGIEQPQWRSLISTQIRNLMPKVKAFAENEDIAAQMDSAMQE